MAAIVSRDRLGRCLTSGRFAQDATRAARLRFAAMVRSRMSTLARWAVSPSLSASDPHVVGQRGQPFARKVDHAAACAENRGPTGRWRSGPCRRSAARATGRPRSRPAPPGCKCPRNIAPAWRILASQLLGVVGGDVQMLRRDLVGQRGRLVGVAHQNQRAELLQALPGQVAALEVRQSAAPARPPWRPAAARSR